MCDVKWALRSITMNKASGDDKIPVELFKIPKDYAVEVLALNMSENLEHSAVATGLERSVSISIPKKGNAKNIQTTLKLCSDHIASKVMLKILWLGFRST